MYLIRVPLPPDNSLTLSFIAFSTSSLLSSLIFSLETIEIKIFDKVKTRNKKYFTVSDEDIQESIRSAIKNLKGPGYYSLDKDNPDHPANVSDKLRKRLKKKRSDESQLNEVAPAIAGAIWVIKLSLIHI